MIRINGFAKESHWNRQNSLIEGLLFEIFGEYYVLYSLGLIIKMNLVNGLL